MLTLIAAMAAAAWSHPLDQGGAFVPMQHIAITDSGEILAADVRAGCIRIVSRDNTLLGRLGEGVLKSPQGVTVMADGRIDVADSQLCQILIFSPSGNLLSRIGARGRRCGRFRAPRAVAASRDGLLAVADTRNHRIQVLDERGRVLLCLGRRGRKPGQFQIPEGIAWDADGNIIVTDTINHRIQIFDRAGRLLRIIGQYGIDPGCLYFPEAAVADEEGRIYVSDTFNQRISIFRRDGSLLAIAYEYGDGIPLEYPYGIALGEDDILWVLNMPSGEIGPVPWEPAPPEVIAAAQKARRNPTLPPVRDRLVNYLTAGNLTVKIFCQIMHETI